MKEAQWWRPLENGKVHCYLCPRDCKIGEGQAGFCFIRKNEGGKLVTLGYGRPAAVQVDPIEKKPLNHFYPGTRIFSMGTAGCNMGCFFCQNWDISKAKADQVRSVDLTPDDICQNAMNYECPSLAFTYNEPSIWGEYVIDISKRAHEVGLKTVMVTNGYINEEAFYDVYKHIDAANVDLKAFTENFYGKITLTHLKPVLDTLERLKRDTNVWFEITNLMIPTLNDDPGEVKQLVNWVMDRVGDSVPLHFTAFHPDFKLRHIHHTPPETLEMAREIALAEGLKYVYVGNVFSDSGNTYCPSCNRVLVERNWHEIRKFKISSDGRCTCGAKIPGYFNYREIVARPVSDGHVFHPRVSWN
jgi:pyruvate formate lyase activating enzyme